MFGIEVFTVQGFGFRVLRSGLLGFRCSGFRGSGFCIRGSGLMGLMEDYKKGKPCGLYLRLLGKAQGLFVIKLRLCF